MNFLRLVVEILSETTVSGGAESAFGPSAQATANSFSGDTYAPGDARNICGVFDGVITRHGIKHKKRRKRKKNKYLKL